MVTQSLYCSCLQGFVTAQQTTCYFLHYHVVPTPLVGGGELYTQIGFAFVKTILADRYIHRREMWMVSLTDSSSVEFKINEIF